MLESKSLKNFLSTGFGQGIGLICQLVIIKILTNSLSLEEFGLFSLIILIPSLVIPLIFCEVISGFCKYFFEYSKEKVYFNSLFFLVSSSLLFSAILVPLEPLVSKTFEYFSLGISPTLVFLALVNHFFIYINSLNVSFFKMSYQSSWLIAQATLYNGVKTILLCYFFFNKNITMETIFYIFILGHFVSFALTSLKIIKLSSCQIDTPLIKKLLNFSKWLIPGSYFGSVINSCDRFLIQTLMNYQSVGIYALGYKVSDLLRQFFIQSFGSILAPAKFNDKIEEKTYCAKLNSLFFIFCLLGLVFGLSLNAVAKPLVLLLSNPDYLPAVSFIPLLIGAHFAWGINDFLNTGYIVKGKSIYTTLVLVVGASLNLILNFFFIEELGLLGASLATILSYLIILPISYHYSKRLHPLRFKTTFFYVSLVVFFITSSIQSFVSNHFNMNMPIILLNLLLAICGSGILLLLLPQQTRTQVLRIIKGVLKIEKTN